MLKLELIAGSTALLSHTPASADSVTLSLLDSAGEDVVLDAMTETDGVWTVTVPSTAVPVSDIGATYTGAFTVTSGTQVRRVPFSAQIVADSYTPSLAVGTDTYVSVDEADEYLSGRLHSDAWDSATLPERTRALLTAARRIDGLPLKHRRFDASQTMQFPRRSSELLTIEPAFLYTAIDESVVPQSVKDAQCEEALALLDFGGSDRTSLQRQGVKSVSVGSLSESYGGRIDGLLSPEAVVLMAPWIAGSVRMRRWR